MTILLAYCLQNKVFRRMVCSKVAVPPVSGKRVARCTIADGVPYHSNPRITSIRSKHKIDWYHIHHDGVIYACERDFLFAFVSTSIEVKYTQQSLFHIILWLNANTGYFVLALEKMKPWNDPWTKIRDASFRWRMRDYGITIKCSLRVAKSRLNSLSKIVITGNNSKYASTTTDLEDVK